MRAASPVMLSSLEGPGPAWVKDAAMAAGGGGLSGLCSGSEFLSPRAGVRVAGKLSRQAQWSWGRGRCGHFRRPGSSPHSHHGLLMQGQRGQGRRRPMFVGHLTVYSGCKRGHSSERREQSLIFPGTGTEPWMDEALMVHSESVSGHRSARFSDPLRRLGPQDPHSAWAWPCHAASVYLLTHSPTPRPWAP